MPAMGDPTLRGALYFDTPAEGSLRALAFVDNAPERWTDFEATAPRAEACTFEQRDAEATIAGNTFHTIMPDGKRHSCSNLTSVRVSLLPDGSNAGWVAFDAAGGGTLNATMPEGIAPDANASIATGDANEACGGDAASPDQPIFCKTLRAAHLRTAATGALEYVGAGCLKVKGPDLRVESDRGVKTYTTDDTADQSMPARERVMRWLVVCFATGTVRFTTPGRVDVAAESAPRVVWDGNVTLTPDAGTLRAATGTYDATRAAGWLNGAFTASLKPTADGCGVVARLDGEVRSTSLRFASAPTGPRVGPGGFEWAGLLVLGAVVVSVSAVVVAKRRRPRVPPRDRDMAQAYSDRGEETADAGEYATAADLLARARKADPLMPKLALREGVYRFMAKDYRAALPVLEDAATLADDGEAEYWAAHAALALGDEETAAHYATCGLERAGLCMHSLSFYEFDPDFAALRERPRVRAALKAARARLRRKA
jgi:hypothetical protein